MVEKNITADTSLVVMGDFNSINRRHLEEYFTSSHAARQLITESTTDTSSTLDLVFTNMMEDSVVSGVIDDCWSDHKIVWCSLQL